jgi:hypothetical protein
MSTKFASPPNNFSLHSNSLMRGAGPLTVDQVNWIKERGCRKFVTLGPIPSPPERYAGQQNKVSFYHYPLDNLEAIVDLDVYLPLFEERVSAIIDFITDNRESLIFVYDENGFSRVGVLCAILRRIEGWTSEDAIREMLRFCSPWTYNSKINEFISQFNITRWKV